MDWIVGVEDAYIRQRHGYAPMTIYADTDRCPTRGGILLQQDNPVDGGQPNLLVKPF
jgi:hypothetical protein